MADPAASSSYQSLYRRYRPQRFDEVLGQEHVTKALRNAVRDGRVGHAYLFSGPRGTGKTSTARILAKALNCANPVDGEPDCQCDNCVFVERGLVVDWLLEQDAASKSKVDDMRDLLDRVPLGTSGKRKVIILDEVHMLSQGAENALLKTLEEPPAHVVFVLATTDPQKVRPTIRSRTQHFTFHLLPQTVLEEHMRHVITDAGIPLSDVDGAVAHVVRSGGGSARDTLSALDQVAALGEVVTDSQPVEAILEALAQRDAGAALVAVADATATGRDPRALGEAVIVRLRDAFLALMGVPDAQEERSRALGEQLGAAGLTRALDVLGEALTELSRKPDPRVVLEVALVRLVRPDADRDLAAVLDRLERLERSVSSGAAVPAPGDVPGGGSAASAPIAAPRPASEQADAPAPSSPGGDAASAAPAGGGAAGGSSTPGGSPSGTSGSSEGDGPASAARAALAAKRGESRGGRGSARRSPSSSGSAPSTADAAQASPSSATPGLATSASDTPTPGGSATSATEASASGGGTTTAANSTAPNGGSPGSSAVATSADSPPEATAADVAPASPEATEQSSGAAPPSPTQAGNRSSDTSSPTQADKRSPQASAPTQAEQSTGATAGGPDLASLTSGWTAQLLGELPLPVRSKWRGGSWLAVSDGRAQFATPNEWHKKACDEGRLAVEQALKAHFGTPVAVEVVVDEPEGDSGQPSAPTQGRSSPQAPTGQGQAPGQADDSDDALSPDEVRELKDAGDVATGGVDLLLKEFGGELVEEDPT